MPLLSSLFCSSVHQPQQGHVLLLNRQGEIKGIKKPKKSWLRPVALMDLL